MERLSEPNKDIVARVGALLICHGDLGMKAKPAGIIVVRLPARCRSCSERGMTPVGFRQYEIFYWIAGPWSRLSSTAREIKPKPA